MSKIKFNCPHCKQSLEAPDAVIGQTIKCPKCNGAIRLPSPSRPPLPQPQVTETFINKTQSRQSGSTTIPCPFCGQQVLAVAITCMHCGEFLNKASSSNVTITGAILHAITWLWIFLRLNLFQRKYARWCTLALLLLILALLLLILGRYVQQENVSERIEQENRWNKRQEYLRTLVRQKKEESNRKDSETQRSKAAADYAAEVAAKDAEQVRRLSAFAVIRSNMNNMTDVQFKQYAASIKGTRVTWVGWVEEVTEKFFGGFECLVDMDPPSEAFSVQDVTFPVSKEIAPRLFKNKQIQFAGTIESVQNIIGSCQVSLKDVDVTIQSK